MVALANVCTFGFPEAGALARKHVRILYGMYDFSRFVCMC